MKVVNLFSGVHLLGFVVQKSNMVVVVVVVVQTNYKV